MKVLYDAAADAQPVAGAAADRQRFERYLQAYRAAGGGEIALAERWLQVLAPSRRAGEGPQPGCRRPGGAVWEPPESEEPVTTEIASRGYARADVLVSTEWVQAHVDDPAVRLIESNEDTLLYASGHIPGAVHVDWTADLNDQIRRTTWRARPSRP